MRSHLGCRYDSKDGVFDWDYHMKLHDMVRPTIKFGHTVWVGYGCGHINVAKFHSSSE